VACELRCVCVHTIHDSARTYMYVLADSQDRQRYEGAWLKLCCCLLYAFNHHPDNAASRK